jgi:uncharacterized membrane protein (UPF0127 family)
MKSGIIFIANNLFETLFAISAEEHQRGLMYVDPPVPVMTFIYGAPGVNKFWMANTIAPLDIIFCHGGKVSEICHGEPHSTSIIGGDSESDLVIELPYGTVDAAQIRIGQPVGLVKPTPTELHKLIAEKSEHFVKF